ncbi:hypothetical protein [Nocardia sp. CS682]|uniref:hypothetical protein n=1 Tax=Nocardia sp. CS682 TaxID=1047172 RepID=UPI00107552CA|nr:hypothetical protein [Nocardia sp. CS682]QBS43842.1 hypothetical protein DMB37_30845 [Nocardia sp. CS682]
MSVPTYHGVPTALGYLRQDVSGDGQAWDEAGMRSLAKRFGYTLTHTIVVAADTPEPIEALASTARRTGVDCVIVPSTEHFDGEKVPTTLTRLVDVITVRPVHTYERWTLSPSCCHDTDKGPA